MLFVIFLLVVEYTIAAFLVVVLLWSLQNVPIHLIT